jgi:hypothetical protein
MTPPRAGPSRSAATAAATEFAVLSSDVDGSRRMTRVASGTRAAVLLVGVEQELHGRERDGLPGGLGRPLHLGMQDDEIVIRDIPGTCSGFTF